MTILLDGFSAILASHIDHHCEGDTLMRGRKKDDTESTLGCLIGSILSMLSLPFIGFSMLKSQRPLVVIGGIALIILGIGF